MLANNLLLLCCMCIAVNGLYEGAPCYLEMNGHAGICISVGQCQAALDSIRNNIEPQLCSYKGHDSIVCCVNNQPQTTSTEAAAPTTPVVTTTSPKTADYEYEYPEYEEEECGPLPVSWTAPKTGRKAWDKCIEYQEQLVYPCERGVILTAAMSRINKCHHNVDELIVGGSNAAENEFPHMAMIGYGALEVVQWMCGGSIISESFVLTAAHCRTVHAIGPASYVAVGVLTRSQVADRSKLYKVKRSIRHPSYKWPIKYHDIALIETETPIKLSQFTVPACLDTGAYFNDGRALATGWGLTLDKGNTSDILQKVMLHKFTNAECTSLFSDTRNMHEGFQHDTQLCYGDKRESRDTCQGDSGGPLQIKSRELNCMYVVVGVTSFGGGCGFVGDAGMYSRMQHYTPWIESVVWPDTPKA